MLGLSQYYGLHKDQPATKALASVLRWLENNRIAGGWGAHADDHTVSLFHTAQAIRALDRLQLGDRPLVTSARELLISVRLDEQPVWPNRVGATEPSVPKTALAVLALISGDADQREAARVAAQWLHENRHLWVHEIHRDPDIDGFRWTHMTFAVALQACIAGGIAPADLGDHLVYLHELWDEDDKSWRDSLDQHSFVSGVIPTAAVAQVYFDLEKALGSADAAGALIDAPSHKRQQVADFACVVHDSPAITIQRLRPPDALVSLTRRQNLIVKTIVAQAQPGEPASVTRSSLAEVYERSALTVDRAVRRLNAIMRDDAGIKQFIDIGSDRYTLCTRRWKYSRASDTDILVNEHPAPQSHMQQRDTNDGLTYFEFPGLAAASAVTHGVFSRRGGTSNGPYHSLNASKAVGDHPENVQQNLARIAKVLAFDSRHLFIPRLVHGDTVFRLASGSDITSRSIEADAVVTDQRDVLLVMTPADCAVVLFYDPEHSAIGMAHAGWKGIVAEIARKTIDAMSAEFGSSPDNLRVAIGPSVGPCHYRLQEPAQKAMPAWAAYLEDLDDGRTAIDLPGMLVDQLLDAGIEGQQLEVDKRCTACNVDTFFSFWVDKPVTGRMAVALGLRS